MRETDKIDQLSHLPGDDPARKIAVYVSAEDCKNGRPGHPMSCAISLALRRMFPEASYACTTKTGITVTIARRYLHFHLDRKTAHFIERFDRLKEPQPGTLALQLVDVKKVEQATEARKAQINEARNKRRAEGRPDRAYTGAPERLRIMMEAKRTTKTAAPLSGEGA